MRIYENRDMLHLTLTRSKNIAEAVNSRNSLRGLAIKRTGRSRRSKFCFALLQESVIKMLVAIVVVSLIASGCSLPLEESVKEQAPQTAVQEISVQDAVKPDQEVRNSPPYPGSYPLFPESSPLNPPVNLPEPVPGNNVQVLPEILPQAPEGGLSQPEGPPQLDDAGNPLVLQGENAQEEGDLKTDSTFWGYGRGWGYRSPYYSWGGYYSNPYRRWGGYGYGGRGYGGWGRGYGGGWRWGGGYRGGWGGGYWGY